MKFIGDFHIHSHFSIATSKLLLPEHLDLWARIKGIGVVGTGDISHPGWLQELEQKLEPAEEGLYTLRDDLSLTRTDPWEGIVSDGPGDKPRFILTGEISSIYKKNGKVRKNHNLIFIPNFETARRFQQELGSRGNISSDGRPILGLDAKELLDLVLNISDNTFFIPAHIWTPWFSVLGAKSGFDSLEECFEDLTGEIHAVETGLSSDPPMNWLCSFLDPFTIISNSDAHSPEKLGREANFFDTELSYPHIISALTKGTPEGFRGTIEFFPQEGKYHYDGHRKCNIRYNPLETFEHGTVCPECGKKLTVGVMSRVAELSDRESYEDRPERSPFISLIPLKEILSEILGVGPNSKKVKTAFRNCIQKGKSEFNILLNLPGEELSAIGGEILQEGIRRMRNREIFVQEGFDGEYGRITVFKEGTVFTRTPLFEGFTVEKQTDIFGESPEPREYIPFNCRRFREIREAQKQESPATGKDQNIKETAPRDFLTELSPLQKEAAEHGRGPECIIAGPGSGKTRTLAARTANLIKNKGVPAESILCITFTNKAASEMKARLKKLFPDTPSLPLITTFHSFGFSLIREYMGDPMLIDEEGQIEIIMSLEDTGRRSAVKTARAIHDVKNRHKEPSDALRSSYQNYTEYLRNNNYIDFDDCITIPIDILEKNREILKEIQSRYTWICIDEFQDINAAQYRFIQLLAPYENANICIIGDPNQAIYGFRGSDNSYISRFKEDYPGYKEFTLSLSYRCPDTLIKAASQVLVPEQGSASVQLKGKDGSMKIHCSEHGSDKSEGEFIARKIEEMVGGVRFFSMDSDVAEGNETGGISSLSDFAVLCRTSRQMDAIEKAFLDHGIPFQKVDNKPFYLQEPVNKIIPEIAKYASVKEQNRTESLGELITRLCGEENIGAPHTGALLRLAESCSNDGRNFITRLRLRSSQDDYDSSLEGVALMTLHGAKGLEWKAVFIPGCEEGLIPYSLFPNQAIDPDEERRLFYVGITRSQNHLFLTWAKRRFLFNREIKLAKSSFLTRIQKDLTENITITYKKKHKENHQLDLFT